MVLDSIHEAVDLGFEVKLNVVVINKVNDMEVLDFVKWTKNLPVYVRFIEYMPFDGIFGVMQEIGGIQINSYRIRIC